MPGYRKLGRPTAHRNAMLRGMVTLLLENGQIETTLTRAKEVRSMAEKMITLGKKNTLATRRAALAYITKEDVVTKLFNEIAPKYEDRQGGYTQIFKLGARRGDAAEMAILRLIGEKQPTEEKKAAPKKAAAKKVEAPATEEAPATAEKAPAKKAPAKKPAASAEKPAAKKAPAKKPAATAEKPATAKKPAATAEKPAAKKAPAKKPAAKKDAE